MYNLENASRKLIAKCFNSIVTSSIFWHIFLTVILYWLKITFEIIRQLINNENELEISKLLTYMCIILVRYLRIVLLYLKIVIILLILSIITAGKCPYCLHLY